VLRPENTLAGFRHALTLGVDATECDVHLTRDGHLVVIHDTTVDRTTNGTGAVRDLTFEEIRTLDAGRGEQVPTLAEVLEVLDSRLLLHVELKGEGVEEAAVQTVAEAGAGSAVVFTSFEFDRLRTVKRIDPTVRVACLLKDLPGDGFRAAAGLGADSVHVLYKLIDPQVVQTAHATGLAIHTWNPDVEHEWRRVIAGGVDGVCTNRPDGLVAMLRGTR
jgi:glycerophosphoryl diester phosphodiesterase